MHPHPLPWRVGDHLRVRRGLYWHHAIFVGGDRLVEFGSSIFGGAARLASYSEFARENRVELVPHEDALPREEIVRRAMGKVGMGGFNVLTHNCEHFATWCATGQWRSGQVVGAAWLLAAAAGLGLLARE